MSKEITLYLWLSYRFEDYFVDTLKAKKYKEVINKYIEKTLQQKEFAKKCKICSSILPKNSHFKMCQKCYKKFYR
jgi:ATP-dependent RNA helicase SUPV3L1/SUV3